MLKRAALGAPRAVRRAAERGKLFLQHRVTAPALWKPQDVLVQEPVQEEGPSGAHVQHTSCRAAFPVRHPGPPGMCTKHCYQVYGRLELCSQLRGSQPPRTPAMSGRPQVSILCLFCRGCSHILPQGKPGQDEREGQGKGIPYYFCPSILRVEQVSLCLPRWRCRHFTMEGS